MARQPLPVVAARIMMCLIRKCSGAEINPLSQNTGTLLKIKI
jgi:hypothetical protein